MMPLSAGESAASVLEDNCLKIQMRQRRLFKPDCLHQRRDSEDLHSSFQIVCQYMQTHLGTYARDRLGQEVSCPHPRFEGAKGMFGGPAAYSRSLWCAVQPPLHRIEYVLMLPS